MPATNQLVFAAATSTCFLLAGGLATDAAGVTILEDPLDNANNFVVSNDPLNTGVGVSFGALNGTVPVRRANTGTSEELGFLTRTIDTTGFENITVTLDASQREFATWEGPEYLEILVDTGSGFVSLVRDDGLFGPVDAGTSAGVSMSFSTDELSAAAEDGSFDVRIAINVGFYNPTGTTREVYFLENFRVEGDVIPEPASLALLGLGGLLMAGRGRRPLAS